MGGQGSGSGMRSNTTRTKDFVEQYECIDARFFPYRYMKKIPDVGIKASAFGVELRVFKNKLEVHHRHDPAHMHFSIPFSLSQGHYGNKRYWFVCPNPICSKRSRRLFFAKAPSGIPLFLCRVCLNLAYRSQNRIKLDRLIDKKWYLIHKLGCDSDCISDDQKPKWMHRRTFDKIRDKIERLDSEAMFGIAVMFGGFHPPCRRK